MYEIYKLTSPSGKSYIGQTKNGTKTRFKQHLQSWRKWVRNDRNRSGGCTKLYYAFDAYPIENWVIETIFFTSDKDIADKQENELINLYNTINEGYNINPGGGTSKGKKMSPETRKRMSEARYEYYQSERGIEDRKKKSIKAKGNQYGRGQTGWLKGKKMPKEIREKIGETLKENYKNNPNKFNILSQRTKKMWKEGKYNNRPTPSANTRKKAAVPFKITHPNGTIEIVELMREWCEANGLNYKSMVANLDSHGKYKGYIGERIYTERKVKIIRSSNTKKKMSESLSFKWIFKDPNGVIITTYSMREWCEANGLNYKNFYTNLSSSGKYKGYTLILKEKPL